MEAENPTWKQINSIIDDAGVEADAALAELVATLRQKLSESKDNALVVLAFDEAHTLTNKSFATSNDRSKECPYISVYDILCDALSVLKREHLVVVTSSTNASILQAAMPPNILPFEQDVEQKKFPPPFTELSFDVCYGGVPIFKYGEMTVDEVSKLKFMSKLGRPL